jgi:predicted methyltransferase
MWLPDCRDFIQGLAGRVLAVGDIAVDGTVGNGHDTVMLAAAVGPTGRVFGFDIQPAAVAATRDRLQQSGLADRVVLFEAGHERFSELLPAEIQGRIRLIIFNLGYLPGGDKSVITCTQTTLAALAQAWDWLAPGGLLLVSLYPGHPGGDEETAAVRTWASELEPRQARVLLHHALNRCQAPQVLAIEKTEALGIRH